MTELRYTKDGVPIYDGSPELYVPYQRAAYLYAETIEWKKRTLVGPRLQAALEGSAKLAVEHKPPGWISHPQGASQLLQCLKQSVRAPTLAEAGRTMSRFFYGIKRRRGEGMAAWVVRHDEALLEAKRTLAEAIHEYGPQLPKVSSKRSMSYKAPSQTGTSHHPSEHGGEENPTHRGEAEAESIGPEEDEYGVIHEVYEDEDPREWNSWWTSWWQPNASWSWERSSHYSGGHYSAVGPGDGSHASWDASEAASSQAEKFLPDFVIAWLLLQRSGLDATEKAVIVANLKNQFSTARVKEALKLTWPDEELKKRDAGKHSAFFTTEEAVLLAEDDEWQEDEAPAWDDPEDEYAYKALEDDAQEAFAAIQDARRTLRDAREKQAQMRRNRNFFPSKGKGKAATRPPVKCFKCGGPHLRRDCPEQGSAGTSEQRANLVFTAVGCMTSSLSNAGAAEPEWPVQTSVAASQDEEASFVALQQAIQEGKAIIDGGATSSLGSEEAVQQIANLNWQRAGDDGITIVPGEAPAFRFGNNGKHVCMATALLKLPSSQVNGQMKVHLHDIPGQPVLLSVQSLRSLGAVIDFSNNEAIFKALDPTKVVTLETTPSGHQLFPLTQDVLSNARRMSRPFKGFQDWESGGHPARSE